MSEPTISVVIGSGELSLLDDTVTSVLRQLSQSRDILIVDSAGGEPTDRGSLARWKREGVQVWSAGELEPLRARKAAIERTVGDIVCIAQAGDVFAADCFRRTVEAFDGDASLTWLLARSNDGESTNHAVLVSPISFADLLANPPEDAVTFVRRSALAQVEGDATDDAVAGIEDWDLWLTLAERGLTGAEIRHGLSGRRLLTERRGSHSDRARGVKFSSLVRRHEATYRAHIHEALLAASTMAADIERRNSDLAQHVTSWLIPAMESRSEELAAIAARLERVNLNSEISRQTSAREKTLEETVARLVREADQARHDLELMRISTSWRMTAPIRQARRLLRWIGGGRALLGAAVTAAWR